MLTEKVVKTLVDDVHEDVDGVDDPGSGCHGVVRNGLEQRTAHFFRPATFTSQTFTSQTFTSQTFTTQIMFALENSVCLVFVLCLSS
jgi:hypothetical protein